MVEGPAGIAFDSPMPSPHDKTALPIEEIQADLTTALRDYRRFVLSAPTGSGKSTRLPSMIREATGGNCGRIVVLQPRRVAARLLARRVAQESGSRLGDRVGYQVRFENVQSAQTEILYITEGILLRRLAQDRRLSDVGTLLFDEFHERHLDSDLSLAIALDLQKSHRPDLIIGVMSATLDADLLADHLAPCARLNTDGRQFPVDIRYARGAEADARTPVWERAATAYRRLAREVDGGSFLIFMPGAYEIRRTVEALRATPEAKGCRVLPLHGELRPEEQDAAIDDDGGRRIIVATNIAETSLTLPGVRAVIDSGLARIPSFDSRRGVNTLLVEKISRASADQRAGRAGRLGPGMCLRLWSEADHFARPANLAPEIHRLDLGPARLQLADLLTPSEITQLPWVDPPEPAAWGRAHTLLDDLGALDSEAQLTPLGRKMAAFPLHPRWSRLLLAGHEMGVLPLIIRMVALCQDRSLLLPLPNARETNARLDKLCGGHPVTSDLFLEVAAWSLLQANRFDPEFARATGLHAQRARRAAEVADQLTHIARREGLSLECPPNIDESAARECLLLGFADHLAKRLDSVTRRCALVHNRRGEIAPYSHLEEASYFVATEVEERQKGRDVSLLLGGNTAIDPEWLRKHFPDDFSNKTETLIDSSTRRAVARTRVVFRDLVLSERDGGEVDPDIAAGLFADGIQEGAFILKNWGPSVEGWIARVNFLARVCPDYGFALIESAERRLLLEQICHGAPSYKELKDRDVWPTLHAWLPDGLLPEVDRLAPERILLPNGARARIRYEGDGAIVSARIQQLYDVPHAQLVLADGRHRPKVELLAPNQRPVQITADLDAFWSTSYLAVKKDLRGRYPKHEWR